MSSGGGNVAPFGERVFVSLSAAAVEPLTLFVCTVFCAGISNKQHGMSDDHLLMEVSIKFVNI